jgi:hypothetical protein
MPFIDSVKRIKVDEFKDEDREVAERIGNIYNFFAEQVTNILNGNIDELNLGRPIITLTVRTSANGTPLAQTRFSAKVGLKGTKVIRAVNTTNSVNYLQSSPFISFSSEGTGVYTVNNVTGLNANEEYQLTLELVF